jgi:hypothetical protein
MPLPRTPPFVKGVINIRGDCSSTAGMNRFRRLCQTGSRGTQTSCRSQTCASGSASHHNTPPAGFERAFSEPRTRVG